MLVELLDYRVHRERLIMLEIVKLRFNSFLKYFANFYFAKYVLCEIEGKGLKKRKRRY